MTDKSITATCYIRKRLALRRIRKTFARAHDELGIGPRGDFATTIGAVAFIPALAIFGVAGATHFEALCLALGSGGLVTAGVMLTSRKPLNYLSASITLLSSYRPLDKVAFQVFEEDIAEHHTFRMDAIKRWVDFEKEALNKALPTKYRRYLRT